MTDRVECWAYGHKWYYPGNGPVDVCQRCGVRKTPDTVGEGPMVDTRYGPQTVQTIVGALEAEVRTTHKLRQELEEARNLIAALRANE